MVLGVLRWLSIGLVTAQWLALADGKSDGKGFCGIFLQSAAIGGNTPQALDGLSNPCGMRFDGKSITSVSETKRRLRSKKSRQTAGRHHSPSMPGMQYSPAAQEQYVSEHRRDFFDVMGYQDQGRRIFLLPHSFQELQKVFPRSGVQPRARLIQNHQRRPRHQRPAD